MNDNERFLCHVILTKTGMPIYIRTTIASAPDKDWKLLNFCAARFYKWLCSKCACGFAIKLYVKNVKPTNLCNKLFNLIVNHVFLMSGQAAAGTSIWTSTGRRMIVAVGRFCFFLQFWRCFLNVEPPRARVIQTRSGSFHEQIPA